MKTTHEMKIKNWYMKSQYIPQLGTVQFAKFAAHGFALIAEINKKVNVGYKIDPNAETAYYDHSNVNVVLPGWYFIPEAVGQLSDSKELELDALALINGSTIHESLHSKLTIKTPLDIIREVQDEFKFRVPQDLVATVVNVVEDIWIENNRSLNDHQREWLAAKNDLFFSDKLWAKLVESFDKSNPTSVANILCTFKREALQEKLAEIVDPKIVELLETVKRKNSLMPDVERVRVVTAIVKIILKDSVKPPESDAETESTDVDEPEDELPEQEYERKTIDEHENPAEKQDPKTVEKIKKAVKKSSKELDKIEKGFEKEAEKLKEFVDREHSVIDHKTILKKLEDNLLITDVSEKSEYRSPLRKIDLTNRFVNLLKQMRTVIPQRGRGKLSGGKLDVLRLHQVAIDNKVFATRSIERTGNNDKVEIILMVDASGSMGQETWEETEKQHYSLYETCLAVSYKIFMALIGSNIQTRVFAHTSCGDYNYPLLIKIADNFTKNFQEKFEQANNLSLNENLDGIIINELVKHQFSSDTRTQKILLVLSDGSPQSPDYCDSVGLPHTRMAIDNARKSGVKVYSISLTEGVNKYNDRLYGHENNVDASNNLDKTMVELVTRLVRRK